MERKTVWEETQGKVTKHSVTLCQEGIEQVREHTQGTHFEVLEFLREPQG